MSQVSVAVVGAGRMGARHVAVLDRLPGVDLVAVCDPSDEALDAARVRPPVARFHDVAAMLGSVGRLLDAVVVACPTALHHDAALQAMDYGLHVLVEKPVALTLADAHRVVERARAAGVRLMVGHVERFNPAVVRVREEVAEKTIGRVLLAHAVRVGPSPYRDIGTGVALDLATHDLDLLAHVVGSPVATVVADGTRANHGEHEDDLACLLRFADGSRGLVEASWLRPEKRRTLEVVGEYGTLRADLVTQEVWLHEPRSSRGWPELSAFLGEGDGAAVRFAVQHDEPLRAELAAFAACVRDGSPPPVTGEDGYAALAAAHAARACLARPPGIVPAPLPVAA